MENSTKRKIERIQIYKYSLSRHLLRFKNCPLCYNGRLQGKKKKEKKKKKKGVSIKGKEAVFVRGKP